MASFPLGSALPTLPGLRLADAESIPDVVRIQRDLFDIVVGFVTQRRIRYVLV